MNVLQEYSFFPLTKTHMNNWVSQGNHQLFKRNTDSVSITVNKMADCKSEVWAQQTEDDFLLECCAMKITLIYISVTVTFLSKYKAFISNFTVSYHQELTWIVLYRSVRLRCQPSPPPVPQGAWVRGKRWMTFQTNY